MNKQIVISLFVLIFCGITNAQKIDHLVSFRNMDSKRYFRFNYDNDYFAASDKNYTQGYNLEFVSPFFNKNPINSFLITPQNYPLKYGFSIEHIGFTPNRYDLPEIQFNDRPFAASIMLKSFVVAQNADKQLRIHSSVNLGIIGPGAFGEEMQVGIHKATGNKVPRGWRHQIKNDIVVNYNIGIEKQILKVNNLASLQIQSNLNLGTLFTNASVGTNVILGKFKDSFSSEDNQSNFQIYVYAQPVISVVGYDATLQGGLINRDSPYTISSENIERFTSQFNLGMVIQTKTLYFEYTRSSITREFATGALAKWGGIRVGFTF